MGCVKRESNPQFNLGRVTCCHYTINAFFVPGYLDRTGDILITTLLQSNALCCLI